MPDRGPAGDLTEILEAIGRVDLYVRGMEEAAFLASMIAYDAVLMNLLVIGEAARRIDAAVLAAEPAVEWAKIIGMRNRIAHGYEDIEPAVVWATIVRDLPALREAVSRLLARHPPPAT